MTTTTDNLQPKRKKFGHLYFVIVSVSVVVVVFNCHFPQKMQHCPDTAQAHKTITAKEHTVKVK